MDNNNNLIKINRLLSTFFYKKNSLPLAYELLKGQGYSQEDAFLYVIDFLIEEFTSPINSIPEDTLLFLLGDVSIDYSTGGHDGYGGDLPRTISFYTEEKTYYAEVEFGDWKEDKEKLLIQVKSFVSLLLPWLP